MLAIGQGIEDQVDFAVADQSGDILAAFMNLADDVDRHTVVIEVFARPFGSDDVIAQFLELRPAAGLRLYRGQRR